MAKEERKGNDNWIGKAKESTWGLNSSVTGKCDRLGWGDGRPVTGISRDGGGVGMHCRQWFTPEPNLGHRKKRDPRRALQHLNQW